MSEAGVEINPVVWGGHVLRDAPCRKTIVYDAVYIPMSSTLFFDRDPHWGIFDATGNLVEDGSYTRLPQRILVGQDRSIDLSKFEIADSPYEEMVYCGPIIPHYGHFVLTSLARLWAVTDGDLCLFHSQPKVFDHHLSYMHQLLSAAGLSKENATSFDHPVRIPRLVVPQASLREQDDVADEYFTTCWSIGEKLKAARGFGNGRFYLSKARLPGGVSGLEREDIIDEAFARAGYTIIFPETLSLGEQVSLFREAEAVVGLAGSGFHTLALVPNARCQVTIFALDYVNSNFLLIEKGMHEKPSYHSIAKFLDGTAAGRFDMTHSVNDINALASYMVEAATKKGRSRPQVVPTSHSGMSYFDFLPRLVAARTARTYLEIGVNTGDMLARVQVPNAVGIDPSFRLDQNVAAHKTTLTLVQDSSDAFFADDRRLAALFPDGIDVSFLDGMHAFEFLLRDFIAAEAHASESGFIAMHDCLPVNGDMIHRDQAEAIALSQATGQNVGWWTGDVWKVVAILKRFRPDLAIHCIDCNPTGLVVVERLDRSNSVLTKAYDEIVAEFMAVPNNLDGLKEFYGTLSIMKAETFAF